MLPSRARRPLLLMAGVLAVVISSVTAGSAVADDCELPRLDGVWTDDGTKQEVRIAVTVSGTSLLGRPVFVAPTVEASYVQSRYCRYPDSSGSQVALTQDFHGDLMVDHRLGKWLIKGTLKLCTFDRTTLRTTGQVDADLSLWMTGNTTLEGHYFDRWDDKSPGWKDITLSRSPRAAAASSARRSKGACPTDDPAGSGQGSSDIWTPLYCREYAKSHPGESLPSQCSE